MAGAGRVYKCCGIGCGIAGQSARFRESVGMVDGQMCRVTFSKRPGKGQLDVPVLTPPKRLLCITTGALLAVGGLRGGSPVVIARHEADRDGVALVAIAPLSSAM